MIHRLVVDRGDGTYLGIFRANGATDSMRAMPSPVTTYETPHAKWQYGCFWFTQQGWDTYVAPCIGELLKLAKTRDLRLVHLAHPSAPETPMCAWEEQVVLSFGAQATAMTLDMRPTKAYAGWQLRFGGSEWTGL